MELRGLIKMPVLPVGFEPPVIMSFGGVRASALTRDDLDDDVRGINSSSYAGLTAGTYTQHAREGEETTDHYRA